MRRVLLLLLAGWAGCAAEHDLRPAAERAAKQSPSLAPPRTEPLPVLQRARLEYLFAAIDRIAQSWPQPAGAAELCLLLLAVDAQWSVNCPEAPSASFVRTEQTFRGQPVFARSGGHFDRDGRSLSTAELLHVMPAAAHVDEPGVRRSDLPAKYPWLLLGSLEGLTAHHPAFEAASTEEWISVALHEVMHTRQLRMPGFAADLSAINSKAVDPSALIALYNGDAEYRRAVEAEYTQLVAAAWNEQQSPAEAARVLADWLERYRKRSEGLASRPRGAQLLRADGLFMYVEGVARYVESRFLVDFAQHPKAALARDPKFRNYDRFAGRGYAGMPNKQLDQEYYYAIGFHVCVLLDRVDPSWKARVHATPAFLAGVTRAVLASSAEKLASVEP